MTIQTFHFEGTPIRDVLVDGDPWWVGKDICTALGISDHKQALGAIPDDERGWYKIPPLDGGGAQEMTCINEPGLYRLIFKSLKPEAERFKRWVLHEVLPEIRRTGGYATQQDRAADFDARFGANGTVPVGAYIALLHEKIERLEAQTKPKKKQAQRSPVTDEERKQIIEMAKAGIYGNEIARQTGRSSGTISGIIKALPLSQRPRAPLPGEQVQIVPIPTDEGDAQ